MMDGRTLAFAAALLASSMPLRAQRTDVPIDSAHGRISFSLGESVTDTTRPPQFSIHYWTERPYNCLLTLVADMTTPSGAVTLSGWRIPPTDICPSAMGPASGGRTLPLHDGANELVIRHRGIDDRYAVVIGRDLIRVRTAGSARISTTADTIIRRLIPGSFAVRCSGAEWLCARAYRELSLVPGVRAFEIPTEGRNPFGIRYDRLNPPDNDPVHYFIAQSSATMASVYSAVQRIRDETSGGPHWLISIGRWTGARWGPRDAAAEAGR